MEKQFQVIWKIVHFTFLTFPRFYALLDRFYKCRIPKQCLFHAKPSKQKRYQQFEFLSLLMFFIWQKNLIKLLLHNLERNLHCIGKACVFTLIAHNIGKCSKTSPIGRQLNINKHAFLEIFVFLFLQIPSSGP